MVLKSDFLFRENIFKFIIYKMKKYIWAKKKSHYIIMYMCI